MRGGGRTADSPRWWRRGVCLALPLLVALPAVGLAQQPDSVRAAARRIFQTRPDSARALMRRLLAGLSPQDSLYPGALFTAGMLAADAGTIATDLQRVAIEYGRSVWADSALLALTELYAAQGDPAATVQAVERLRRDYPDSPLRPHAAFAGARAYFDLKDDAAGCVLIQEALAGAGGDVEFRNRVSYYAARCPTTTAVAPVTTATATTGDSQARAAATAAAYAPASRSWGSTPGCCATRAASSRSASAAMGRATRR